ncbi:hypothetical protein ACFYZJ_21235 [Streptomyces sp. NPDC001848]|uniref:hypothetical protein n=1 Tax=Streptomyces sp. NPDC001848 TaxID=3364618 RepID=UPI0036AB0ACB
MRLATVLLLIGALFGAAPAAAQAAPSRDSASYLALSSKRGGGVSGGGISKSGGYKKSRGSGYTYRYSHGSSYPGKKKMPLWQAILVLLGLGCLVVWGVVKCVRKLQKVVSG